MHYITIHNNLIAKHISLLNMVRPVTRNQRIATWFNNAAWPVEYDTALMDALQRRTRNIADLSSSDVFEAVIEQVWADMVRLLGRSFSLHEVKVRITTIRRRFYQFMLFTTLPGVNFNRHTARLRIGAEYTQHLNGVIYLRPISQLMSNIISETLPIVWFQDELIL